MFGFATMFNSKKAKEKGVYEKVLKKYYDIGGEKDKIDKAIKAGAKKKPKLNRKIRKQLDSGKLSGISGLGEFGEFGEFREFGELGEPISIGAMISLASAPVIAAWKWIKDAGLDKLIEKIPDIIPDKKARDAPDDQQPDNSDNEYLPDNNKTSYSPDIPDTTDEKPNAKKYIIFGSIAITVMGVGAVSYYLYNKNKKKTLTGITYN